MDSIGMPFSGTNENLDVFVFMIQQVFKSSLYDILQFDTASHQFLPAFQLA